MRFNIEDRDKRNLNLAEEYWGLDFISLMATEEMGELLTAISHHNRG